MMRRFTHALFYCLLAGFSCCALPALAQSVWAPHDPQYYHLLDRYEIRKGGFADEFHSSFRPIERKSIARFAEYVRDSAGMPLSQADRFNLQFLLNDNWEWSAEAHVEQKPLLRHFYKAKPDFYHVRTRDFDLHVNPVLDLRGGRESGSEVRPFLNTRGVEIRASVDDKVAIYTFLGENQAAFPTYVRNYIYDYRAVPGEAFYKRFKDDGVDFFTARGYVSVQATKHIGVQFGQDRFFIGNGQRSLMLSDVGATYPFLKVQTQVWRFSYTNLIAQLRGDVGARSFGSQANQRYPVKYLSMHHLSFNITDNFNIGLFEAVISGDSVGSGFEAGYLNPVIFYRAVEQYGGSPDNAKVGMDMKWNFLRRFQIYGQFVLDEFLLDAYRQREGWWGNKWALQLGGKYIDVLGIPNLDLQLEWNRVRPYMYTHMSHYTDYTHYSQVLAHPLGANFDEQLAVLRYQPAGRWSVEARFMQTAQGLDPAGANYGGNIFKDYMSREQDLGNYIGQGIATHVQMADLIFSYMPAHRLFLELHHTQRRQHSELEALNMHSGITQLGLRWNIARRSHMF